MRKTRFQDSTRRMHADASIRDRVISHHQNISLTYDGLDRDSNVLVHGLLRRGLKKGDRVAVSLGNCVEYATVRTVFIEDAVVVAEGSTGYIRALQARSNTRSSPVRDQARFK